MTRTKLTQEILTAYEQFMAAYEKWEVAFERFTESPHDDAKRAKEVQAHRWFESADEYRSGIVHVAEVLLEDYMSVEAWTESVDDLTESDDARTVVDFYLLYFLYAEPYQVSAFHQHLAMKESERRREAMQTGPAYWIDPLGSFIREGKLNVEALRKAFRDHLRFDD